MRLYNLSHIVDGHVYFLMPLGGSGLLLKMVAFSNISLIISLGIGLIRRPSGDPQFLQMCVRVCGSTGMHPPPPPPLRPHTQTHKDEENRTLPPSALAVTAV